MSSKALTEGLLYSTFRNKSPPLISQNTLYKWYDVEHMPAICNSKDGPTIGLRYRHTSSKANTESAEATADVPFPILAIYKVHDTRWLTSDEGFLSVPIRSDLFPIEVDRSALGVSEVQLRSYELMARSLVRPGPEQPKYVVTLEMLEANQVEYAGMMKVYGARSGYRGSMLYSLTAGLLEHEQKDLSNQGLVIAWFDEMQGLDGFKGDAQVWEFMHEDGREGAEF